MRNLLKIITALALFAIIAIVFYAATAFVFWELNPGKWSETGRYFMAFFSLIFGVSGAATAIVYEKTA